MSSNINFNRWSTGWWFGWLVRWTRFTERRTAHTQHCTALHCTRASQQVLMCAPHAAPRRAAPRDAAFNRARGRRGTQNTIGAAPLTAYRRPAARAVLRAYTFSLSFIQSTDGFSRPSENHFKTLEACCYQSQWGKFSFALSSN